MLPDSPSDDLLIHETSAANRDHEVPVVRKERPTGVTILSVLHLIGGVGLLFLLPGMLSQSSALDRAGQTVGTSGFALIVGFTFLAALSLATGIGFWKGTRWGWWVGAFYYIYAIARNLSALVTIISLADELAQQGGRGLPYYVVKHTARIAIHFLILVYLFKSNVLGFFGVADISKGRAVAKLVGLCGAISVVATILSLL